MFLLIIINLLFQGNVPFRVLNKMLTGNVKFELSTGLDEEGWSQYLYSLVGEKAKGKEKEEVKEGEMEKERSEEEEVEEMNKEKEIDDKIVEFLDIFEQAQTTPPFDKDLDNEIYKLIIQKMKEI